MVADLPTILGGVAIVVGLAGALGLLYATFQTNLSSGTIKLLQDNNAALKEQSDLQDIQILDLNHKLEIAETQIRADALRISTLESLVPGTVAIAALTLHVDAQHREIMEALARD